MFTKQSVLNKLILIQLQVLQYRGTGIFICPAGSLPRKLSVADPNSQNRNLNLCLLQHNRMVCILDAHMRIWRAFFLICLKILGVALIGQHISNSDIFVR